MVESIERIHKSCIKRVEEIAEVPNFDVERILSSVQMATKLVKRRMKIWIMKKGHDIEILLD